MAPRTRLPSWLSACFLGLTLAACGGGGGGSNGSGDSGSGSGADDTRTASPFIAPAGALCAQRDANSNNCIQPTSSSTDEQALFDAISDPNGSVIDFDGPGYMENELFSVGKISITSYGMARRRIQAGRNAFTVDGRRYGEGKRSQSGEDIRYVYKGDRGSNVTVELIKSMGHRKETLWGIGLREDERATTPDTTGISWTTVFGVLTDQADAPKTRKVRYVGTVWTLTGTDGRILEVEDVTYETELDTVTGRLAGVRIDYTNPKTRKYMQLELPELKFENSRLDSASRQQRTSVQTGITSYNHSFTLDGLEGEILGKQAASIYLVGGGAKGALQVTLRRKDQMESDAVINVPFSAKP
ncbi:hypothetical protein D5038_05185 [Verminephrobacter aporrectodeae subsp. tuberculatae]|uniref:hypothetical protein n=1 Tax=Verminephrobacter aporrectodeae TaxID=1110389 RepID=UPI0022374640|nr:hypothetical protein [Verminephrobacter aporrectodeae]MCW5255769.1 hypothetical protein [Verminephrobacter aporrectodeae subsp. tuberculatae]